MGKIAFIVFISVVIIFNTVCAQNITKIEGVVVDENNITLPYVSVRIGAGAGTVTNSEGSFIVEFSGMQLKDSLSVSCIGYKNIKIPLSNLHTGLRIRLSTAIISLNEIVIRPVSAESIIRRAMKNVPQNYVTGAFEMVGFYRETGRIDSNYLSFAEASLNILNQGYNSKKEKDLVVINKERSLKKVGDREVNNPFHAAVKGVAYIVLDNDIVKHPGAIFGEDYLSKYKYDIVGSTSVNGEDAYVIKFDQKDGVRKALYKGTVVIIKSSYAIVSVDFALSPKGVPYTEPDVPFLQRPMMKLLGYSLEKVNEELSEKYVKLNGKWYPYFYKIETTHHVKAKKQHIDGNLHISAELFISKVNEHPRNNYSKELVMPDDYVFKKVVENYKDDYWDGFNLIKPTSSLKEIAEKINTH
ncbi:carboxypeptidase-like regulatory domain-containing protein [Pedobacter sp. L105]|uniref:carboxypeptidase-like regulatory domain-containing protein n=1 Tax=Pedobacter sp. L105 TaxID=1641871 RepID=UPI00131B0608|nr:carboxypeptidase-like regulatory domain-containing protein [Pedobacter sp. L105]